MRFKLLILMASFLPAFASGDVADRPKGMEALKGMFEGELAMDKIAEAKVKHCSSPVEPRDRPTCKSVADSAARKCDSALRYVREVDAESQALIATLGDNVKDNAVKCAAETEKMKQAVQMAQRVCESCGKSCGVTCVAVAACNAEGGTPACLTAVNDHRTKICGESSGSIKPGAESILSKAESLKGAATSSIADNAKCVGTVAASSDGDGTKPAAEEDDTGGGEQQQAQNQDAGGDDAEEETKKDDKAAGGAGGMDPAAMMEALKGEEEEEEDVECSKETQPYLIAKCMPDVVKACTSGDPNVVNTDGCKSFANHYCYAGKAEGSGGGIGTDYCSTTLQKNFCADATRARTCAGCLAQSASTSCGTAGSPVGCTADTSCSVAKNAGPLCTGDPYLLSANYISSCVSAMATGNAGFSTPVTGLAAMSAGGGGGGGMSGMGTASAAGVTEATPDDTGNREGLNLGVESQGGYSAASSGGDFSDEGSTGGGGQRGRAGARRVAAADAGSSMPTDVSSTHGPNTFSIISSVLKVRCNSFKHLHCEPQ